MPDKGKQTKDQYARRKEVIYFYFYFLIKKRVKMNAWQREFQFQITGPMYWKDLFPQGPRHLSAHPRNTEYPRLSEDGFLLCCFTSTETVWTVTDG